MIRTPIIRQAIFPTKTNNRRWFSYYQLNLKIPKRFHLLNVRSELSVDIRNVFNQKFLRRLYGDDLIQLARKPQHAGRTAVAAQQLFNEPDVWNWHTYEVPPREAYLQFKN